MDVIQTEREIYQHPKKATPDQLLLLIDHYSRQAKKEKDVRKKAAFYRKVVHLIGWIVKIGINDKEQLKGLLDLLNEAFKNRGGTYDFSKIRAQTIAALLKASGIDKIKYLKKTKGSVGIEGGTMSLADPQLLPDLEVSMEDLDKEMARGEKEKLVCYFDTEGDGRLGAEIRLINAPEPVLLSTEYQKVIFGREGIIKVVSGLVGATDIVFSPEAGRVSLKVEPGEYKVAGFLVNKKNFFGYIFILAKK